MLKAWSFQLRKNYFCMLNIECPIAHQSSINFFLIHPVLTRNCGKYFRVEIRKHFVLALAKLNVSEHIAPLTQTLLHIAISIASQKI